jgi:hypothetical protein
MLYHTTGKQSPSSNGSNGQGHRQAPQLQAANEQPEIQKNMDPVSSQQIWVIGKWHWREFKNSSNTIKFIFLHKVLTDRMKDVTYRQFVCPFRPKKAEPNQMQFKVGGDRINYPCKVATPTAEMLVAKMLFNSVISTKSAQFITIDISNFYLMTPLHCAKIN